MTRHKRAVGPNLQTMLGLRYCVCGEQFAGDDALARHIANPRSTDAWHSGTGASTR